MKDFYYILGTANDASTTEIEAAYHKLARKFMDEQDAFMDAHFREIAEAYDILRDDRRRRKYDAAFRRSQKRYLAAFRLKYLNIAVTLTFLVVTALFAGYVIRNLQGHPKKIVPKLVVPPAATVAAPVHIKKHHKALLMGKPLAPLPSTDNKIAVINPKPPVTSASAAIRPVPRAAPDSATLHANVTGIIYLHESPDYASPLLVKLPDASRVQILQKGDAWYKVSVNGQEGYVIKSAVER